MTNLFEDFNPVDEKRWREKIVADLKGGSLEDLYFKLSDGSEVDPTSLKQYDAEEISDFPINWKSLQFIVVDDPVVANKIALDALLAGADGISFELNKPLSKAELSLLFKDISIVNIPISLKGIGVFDADCLKNIQDLILQPRNEGEEQAEIALDVLSHIAWTGEWQQGEADDLDMIKAFLNHRSSRLLVDLTRFCEAGADGINQLSIALSVAQAYVKHCGEQILDQLCFQFATGPDFLVELSKYRAFRRLWAFFTKAYNQSSPARIKAVHNLRYETVFDDYNNLLRHCTANMAAALGGADQIEVVPFNRCYKSAKAFEYRMARNVCSILKEESHLSNYKDPAAGAYYMEALSFKLEEAAYAQFQKWEAKGGYLKCLSQGIIQQVVEEADLAEQTAFKEKKLVLIGSNIYENLEEHKQEEIEFELSPLRTEDGLEFRPIQPRRLSEQVELKRLEKEEA